MIPPQFLGPFILSNVLGLLLIVAAVRWPRVARTLFVVLFLGAGLVNMYLSFVKPRMYVTGFGPVALLEIYRTFIYGFFASHTALIVLLISIGQLAIAALLYFDETPMRLGVIGAVIFFLAIAPLGVGSAFPSTIFMAVAALLVYWKL